MKPQLNLVKLALCGPGDVKKEILIAQEVATEWNLQHGEASGFWLKHQHWSMDSYPDLSDRPQGIINRQMIDGSDIIVAIFWSRFGTPTGVAGSGTEEEIRRGIKLGRKVLVYFSALEPLPVDADKAQLERLWGFRRDLQSEGLCWKFSSRDQFRKDLTRHLAKLLHEFKRVEPPAREIPSKQTIVGDQNIQVGGDLNVFNKPPVIETVLQRREGSVSPKEARQIQLWIEELAEGTMGMNRNRAFGMWWNRFKRRFEVEKYEELPSQSMDEAQAWFRQQRAIQTRGLKTKAPDEWRQKRIGAIKAAMAGMGATKESYYPELARRLRMKKPFISLKDLTKRDLDRVYRLALGDARGT